MTREEAIKSMYQYKATEDDQTVVPYTFELIYNWYIEGWDSIEKLETMFDIEDLSYEQWDYNTFNYTLFIYGLLTHKIIFMLF